MYADYTTSLNSSPPSDLPNRDRSSVLNHNRIVNKRDAIVRKYSNSISMHYWSIGVVGLVWLGKYHFAADKA